MADPASPSFDPTYSMIILRSGRAVNLDPLAHPPMTQEQSQRLSEFPPTDTFRQGMRQNGKTLGERENLAWEVFQDRIERGESEAQALSTTRKLFGLEPMDAQTMAALEGALVTHHEAPELMSPITAEEAKAALAQVGKPEMLPTGPRITSMEMLDVVLIQNHQSLDDLLAVQEKLGNHQLQGIKDELDNGGFFSLAADGTLTLFHKDGQTQNLTRFTPVNINELNQPASASHTINVENHLLAQMGFAGAPTPGSQFGTLDSTQREEAISNFREKIGLKETGPMEQRTRDALTAYADEIAEHGNTEKAIAKARTAAGLDAGNQQKLESLPNTQAASPTLTPSIDPATLPPGSMIGAGQPSGFSAINGFNPPAAEAPQNAQETRHIPLLEQYGFKNLEAFKQEFFRGMDSKEKAKYTEKNVIDAVGFYAQYMERSQNNVSQPSPDALRKEAFGFARTFARYLEEIPANSPAGTHHYVEPFPSQPNMQNMPANPNGQAPDGGAMDESIKRMQDALGPKGQRLTPEQMRQYSPDRPQEGASTGEQDPMIEVLAKNGIKPGMTFSEIAASTMFQSQYNPMGDPPENPQKGRGMS